MNGTCQGVYRGPIVVSRTTSNDSTAGPPAISGTIAFHSSFPSLERMVLLFATFHLSQCLYIRPPSSTVSLLEPHRNDIRLQGARLLQCTKAVKSG
jgi:hypothetical protein